MRLTSLFALALLIPAIAQARPIVWWHTYDKAVSGLPNPDDTLSDERDKVVVTEFAIDRRRRGLDQRKTDRRNARELRREARKDRRMAGKEFRDSAMDDDATMRLTAAQRQTEEADDYVDLQTARVRAARQLMRVEKARLSQAIAQRELAAATLVYSYGTYGFSKDMPSRFARQADRIQRAVQRNETDWQLARVDLREASQDHWSVDDINTFVTTYRLEPLVVQTMLQDRGIAVDLDRVYFDVGAHHPAESSKDDMFDNASILRRNRDVVVRIEGHADATGSDTANLELAWDRVGAVAARLHQLGVWESQIETVALGENDPVRGTEPGSRMNRRVEFRIVEKGDGLVDGSVEEPLSETLGDTK